MSKETHVKYIIKTTETFLTHLIKDLNEAGARELMPAPAIMLHILDEVMLALSQSMVSEFEAVMRSDLTAEKKGAYLEDMTGAIVEQSIDILSEHLPIKLQAIQSVKNENIDKVLEAIDEINGTTH